MLTLRKTQVVKLGEYMRTAFEKKMFAMISAKYPDQSEKLIQEVITQGIDRCARDYGIKTEHDVQRFIELMFLLAPDFDDTYDWAREILNNDGFDARQKVDLLFDYLSEHDL